MKNMNGVTWMRNQKANLQEAVFKKEFAGVVDRGQRIEKLIGGSLNAGKGLNAEDVASCDHLIQVRGSFDQESYGNLLPDTLT
jgi:hypothetical protein